jgi:hypothetical protein
LGQQRVIDRNTLAHNRLSIGVAAVARYADTGLRGHVGQKPLDPLGKTRLPGSNSDHRLAQPRRAA